MEFYSQRGYTVIKPDLRGQGLSIGAGSADGAYYSMAYNTDLMSLISAVKLTDNLNANKINLWGHSMGAYIALRASVLSPDIKNTVLLAGPVGSVRDMYNAYVAISDTGNQTAGAIRAAVLTAKGTPNSNPEYWEKTSPLNYLDKSKSFYQIHIGSSDRIVPPKFSADFDAVLSNLNKPHEYFVYQGGDHGLLGLRSSIWARSVYRLDQTR
jgi:dipeptidyl aminopeptidase/acylaminoacyl peptidase